MSSTHVTPNWSVTLLSLLQTRREWPGRALAERLDVSAHTVRRDVDRLRVDGIMAKAPGHGWRPLSHDRSPHAGGAEHDAGWLENSAGFKVEVVADEA